MKKLALSFVLIITLYLLYAWYNEKKNKIVEAKSIMLELSKDNEKVDTLSNSDFGVLGASTDQLNLPSDNKIRIRGMKRDTSKLSLKQYVTKPVLVVASFAKALSFHNIEFEKDASFSNSYFHDSFPTHNNIDVFPFEFHKSTFQNFFLLLDTSEVDINFEECTFKGRCLIGPNNFKNNKRLLFGGCNFRKGFILGSPFNNKFFQEGYLMRFGYDDSNDKITQFSNNRINTLVNFDIYFNSDTLKGTLDFSHCIFSPGKSIQFDNTFLPDTIDLSYVALTDSIHLTSHEIFPQIKNKSWAKSAFLKFLLQPILDTSESFKCKINLVGTDVNKINLEYKYFNFYFPKGTTDNEITHSYESLLEKFKKDGETYNYELLDIDYHDYQGGLFNFFSKYWWNYGYSKWLIFIWSFLFIFIFTIVNFKNFTTAIICYPIKSIENILPDFKIIRPHNQNRLNKRSIVAASLYTSIVFFGIKLDVENINFKNFNYSLFVLLQFMIGLVCTGFIVHLIIH